MRIADIRFDVVEYAFDQPMKVAFGVIDSYSTLLTTVITDDGLTGYGEAAPIGFLTGDTVETSRLIGSEFRDALVGESPLAITAVHATMDAMFAHNTPVKAAIDMACYDIAAKSMGVPLYRYLGGSDPHLVSDVTLGMATASEMAATAAEWVAGGWRHLKIKLGEDPRADAGRVRAIREAVGPDVDLRVDANAAWRVWQAQQILPELSSLGVSLVEQPLAPSDHAGLRLLTAASALPIVADESCFSPADAADLARDRDVDGISIKLMKCGGILPAARIAAVCQANNLFNMIGCMGESRIAITAAMHFAAAAGNVIDVDLDTTFYSGSGPVSGGFTNDGERCTLLDRPGLGVAVA